MCSICWWCCRSSCVFECKLGSCSPETHSDDIQVFQNDVAKQTVSRVTAAASGAGLSSSQITTVLTSLTNIPKLTSEFGPDVVAVIGRAQQLAIAHGIKLVALTR